MAYYWRSIDVARGAWTTANYSGALRSGFNIPAGALMAVFGTSPFAATLWPLLCSLTEIALVYLLASELWGRRAAVCTALVITSVRLHNAVATHIHALRFVLFFFSAKRRSPILFFCRGLAMGAVFWAKELAVVTLFAFFAFFVVGHRLAPIGRRWDGMWLHAIAGALLMMVLHLALMKASTGNPLHLVKVVLGAVDRSFVQGGWGQEAAGLLDIHNKLLS